MKPIHQEHFEAWLFLQPDTRTWNYMDNCGCLAACFLKESGVAQHVNVGGYGGTILLDGKRIDVPLWLNPVLREVCELENKFTGAQAKAAYLKVYPQHNPESNDIAYQNERVAPGCSETAAP